ncbi:aldo/keto reductase [Paenibacillus sp. ACRRX]|uniref:aldo/keto reductase n=1 Tax=unclassified Paenibacillus TaxID=185978 RepID=UPI001EF56C8B|nr:MULTISPECIES: aldo/keto reductase [unclassified Paenibacillus]MCG7410217.1 aldo/keto reductase [Paenibacillus sp. ACRRX]MDK8183800.1 aldo/keto reductase [Paenibacillus sp. UMB4589-SE434]
MKRIPLQQRGLATSRLILGCMPFGGSWDREPISQEDVLKAERAVDAALSIGINMFDHANIYTMGKAEETFGRILKGRPQLREQMVIQSKCGIRFAEGDVPGRFDFSKEHILSSVDATLGRLGIDYLDILLLHRPDPLMEPDEVAEAFGHLKAAGKVKYFGVSNMSASQIKFLQRSLPDQLAVNQLEMSLGHLHWLDQGVHVNQQAGVNVNFAEGLMEYCQMERIQIQAWGPLAQGRFTGRSTEGEPAHVQQTAMRVQRMAAEKETTPEAIVLGWLMKHPAGIQPIIGSANADRILACEAAEEQARLMSREEWYSLYVSSRGQNMP